MVNGCEVAMDERWAMMKIQIVSEGHDLVFMNTDWYCTIKL
jgi:hypothetical protein